MEKKDLYHFKKRLLLERKKMDEGHDHGHLGFEESLTGSTQELSAYDNHPADLGTETYERGKDLGLQDAKRLLRAKIDEALERIDRGDYGSCMVCGEEIPLARLEALPYAVNCLACQERLEKEENRRSERPVEEEILDAHLTDPGGDDPGLDREEIQEQLYRYGTADSPQDLGGEESYNELYTDEPLGVVERVEKEQTEE
ncbi:MAG: conjugal transfer protein TraR [Firmicutes bacterium]|nr:conjugal transfer protein TraR [Bacillota bacterium]